MDMSKSARRCILNPTHALRGWLMLAYGVQQRDSTVTKFMPKHDYAFLPNRSTAFFSNR